MSISPLGQSSASQCSVRGISLIMLLALSFAGHAQEPAGTPDPRIVTYLEDRVQTNPDDASSWRLLSRAYRNAGNIAEASEAIQQALKLEPSSAAVQMEWGFIQYEQSDLSGAAYAFSRVVELAPESDYAAEAKQQLQQLPAPIKDANVTQAGYEITRFDGSQIMQDRNLGVFSRRPDADTELPPIVASFDLGVLYNTNVALTPSSREFSMVRDSSFQMIASPKLEYWLYEGEVWRAGPVLAGDFTVNTGDSSGFDLQSYRPGVFVERSVFLDDVVIIPRLQYVYSLDLLGRSQFDQRHALTASATSLWNSGDTTLGYVSTNYTNFTDDGATPATTSRDGWTYGMGIGHTHRLPYRFLSAVTMGADLEQAEVIDTTYAYRGIATYVGGEVPLTSQLSLVVDGGWGYRDYHLSTVTPSRNESIWHGGARLQYLINDYWSISGVFKYDRFDSPNALFSSDRILTGLVTSWTY